jgi:hypothetical protein
MTTNTSREGPIGQTVRQIRALISAEEAAYARHLKSLEESRQSLTRLQEALKKAKGDRDAMIVTLWDGGHDYPAIMSALGCGSSQIHYTLKRAGRPTNRRGQT